jgi:hypothetical protein
MAQRGRRTSKHGPKAPAPPRYTIDLSARRFPAFLLVVSVALLGAHLVINLWHHFADIPREPAWPWLLRQGFDVDQEHNLPSWFSSFLLGCAAWLLWLIARRARAEGMAWSRHWMALALGFLLLSIDEVAGLHETLNTMIEIPWTVPGGIVAVLACLAFVPLVRSLPRRTATLFVVSGISFIFGAIGIEIIGTGIAIDELHLATLKYNLWALLEESLEMLSIVLFIYALLRYMGDGAAATLSVGD